MTAVQPFAGQESTAQETACHGVPSLIQMHDSSAAMREPMQAKTVQHKKLIVQIYRV